MTLIALSVLIILDCRSACCEIMRNNYEIIEGNTHLVRQFVTESAKTAANE